MMDLGGTNVLVCSPELPEGERQSGSRRLFYTVDLLHRAGASVSVVSEYLGTERDQARVRRLGVPVHPLADIEVLLSIGEYNIALIAFWTFAERIGPLIRERSPATQVVVDSIDVHFVRDARDRAGDFEGVTKGGVRGPYDERFALEMARELNCYVAADLVLTVSDKEASLVCDLTNDPLKAVCVRDWEEFPPGNVSFEERRGILFIGNFRHQPNTEAVYYLCQEIVPRLGRETLDAHPVTVVGNDLSGEILELCRSTPGVQPVGFVPSVYPYLERTRVFVAPLLNGAGTKRKLIQALSVGTPTVATSIAAEGLEVSEGEGLLIEDATALFAEKVIRLAESRSHWSVIAGRGRTRVAANHGGTAIRQSLSEAMDRVLARRPDQGTTAGGGDDSS